MSQVSNCIDVQESSKNFEGHQSLANRSKPDLRPNIAVPPLQLPLFVKVLKPQKRPFEKLLSRLSSMQMPAKEHVEEYLRYQYRRNFKPNTLRSSLAGCELFLKFSKAQGKTDLSQINRQDLEAFVEHEQDRGVTVVTIKSRLAVVYAFLRFLNDQQLVASDVLVKKIRLRLPEPLPKAISPEDVKKLLAVLDDVRDHAMILVLLRTGMRIGELLDKSQAGILCTRQITILNYEKPAFRTENSADFVQAEILVTPEIE